MALNQNSLLASLKSVLIILALILSFLLISFGCGGGIGGTGDIRETRVEGKVLNVDGAAVEGATVTVLETGDAAVTDPEGNFSIETDLPSGELSLAVQTDTADTSVSLGTVPKELSAVTVVLALDDSRNSVAVISTNIPPPSTTAPTPTPSRPDTGGPNETPSTPTPVPTEVVVPVATQTPAPTPTETPPPTATPALKSNRYQGILRRISGVPVSNSEMKILETGDSDITDSNGFFSILTNPIGGDITIKKGPQAGGPSAIIPNVPSTGGLLIELVITFEVQVSTPTITINSINISELE